MRIRRASSDTDSLRMISSSGFSTVTVSSAMLPPHSWWSRAQAAEAEAFVDLVQGCRVDDVAAGECVAQSVGVVLAEDDHLGRDRGDADAHSLSRSLRRISATRRRA